ncbi:hypothetical protein CIRG_09792 [Coccidioides immitis RMSCC 2394]|uniref:Uncharacterized protein n=1 Tax=Coccidioides immitis RMSCC 2394 TaxID=404692 RepID=A0A0J7BH58_COCIT|nr:hypothetical protein CIRG_09792 [Coccidioides immitis RMSCC 2394]
MLLKRARVAILLAARTDKVRQGRVCSVEALNKKLRSLFIALVNPQNKTCARDQAHTGKAILHPKFQREEVSSQFA